MWQELDGKQVGNKTLKVSDVIPRSFEKQNKDEKQVPSGEMNSDSVSKGRSARSVVTPLADMSYAEQLENKKNSLMQALKKLVRISCI